MTSNQEYVVFQSVLIWFWMKFQKPSRPLQKYSACISDSEHILNKILLFITHICTSCCFRKIFYDDKFQIWQRPSFLCQCRRNGAKVALWHCYPNDWVAKGVACASCLNNMHAYNEEYSRCLKLMSAPFLICTSEFSESS